MKIKKLLIFGLPVLVVILFFVYLSSQKLISPAQERVIEIMGDPAQFSVTYLPQGSSSKQKLARYETWYYPKQQKKVVFLSGKLIDSQTWQSEQKVAKSSFRPWDFDFYSSYQELVAMIGEQNLHLLDLPGFNDEGLQTYTSQELMFVLEDDYLTYVQTLAYEGSKDSSDITEKEQKTKSNPPTTASTATVPPKQANAKSNSESKNYSSSDLGFSLNYPDDWYLQNGVLTNYDTNYLVTGGTLPEKIIKCDFVTHQPDQLKLEELSTLEEDQIKISQTKAIASSEDSLGFGDNVVFLIEAVNQDSQTDDQKPIAVICYAYNQDFQDQLLTSLKTIQFIE